MRGDPETPGVDMTQRHVTAKNTETFRLNLRQMSNVFRNRQARLPEAFG